MNEREQQMIEIASEHNFDRDIDHSQPHDPTDLELRVMDLYANPNQLGTMSCAHGTPKEEPCEQCTEEAEALCDHGENPEDCSECAFEEDDVVDDFDRSYGPQAHFYRDNEGYRPCTCEDYPCCGH